MAKPALNAIRCNISLPADLVENVDKVCNELGCARSVYIAMALRAKLSSDAMLEKMPEMVTMMHEMMTMAKAMDDKKIASAMGDSGGAGA